MWGQTSSSAQAGDRNGCTAWWGNLENPPWKAGATTPAPPCALQDWAELPELQVIFQEKQEINFFKNVNFFHLKM